MARSRWLVDDKRSLVNEATARLISNTVSDSKRHIHDTLHETSGPRLPSAEDKSGALECMVIAIKRRLEIFQRNARRARRYRGLMSEDQARKISQIIGYLRCIGGLVSGITDTEMCTSPYYISLHGRLLLENLESVEQGVE